MRSRALLLLLCLSECCGQELYQDDFEEDDDDYYTDFYYNYAGDTTVTDQPSRTPDWFKLLKAKFSPKGRWPGQRVMGSEPNEQQWETLSSVFDEYFGRSDYGVRRAETFQDEFGNINTWPKQAENVVNAPGGVDLETPANRDITTNDPSRRTPRPSRKKSTTKTETETPETSVTTTTPSSYDYSSLTTETNESTTITSTDFSTTLTSTVTWTTSTPTESSTRTTNNETTTTTYEEGPTTRNNTWYPPWVRTYWSANRPHTYPKGLLINGTWYTLPMDWPFDTPPTIPPVTTTTLTPTTTTRVPTLRLDILGLLSLIANLTYFYDMNLTERFNETLIKYGVPTCASPTTTLTPSPTTPVYDFANTTIVGKCFVCGLDKEAIPQDAYCADAFAGDFLPLMPVDPKAKGQIARYRKYCRYLDVRHYEYNPDEPRAVYGRFTGGCSVRWTDLSGAYTQRACRNKRRAVLGKHFASKRMAKLEMALNNVDNGCIISPMATLLPLSRGVSLYARFHACVCTGAWCNRAPPQNPWMIHYTALVVLYAQIIKFVSPCVRI